MKKLIYISAVALLAACSQPQKEEAKQPEQETKEQAATSFVVDNASAQVYWTAYKHTSKVGVKGKFDSLKVENTKPAVTVEEAITGASFEIYTTSVNSKDGGRDAKIREFYFGKMVATDVIKGSIKSAENGTAKIDLTINETMVSVDASYELAGNELTLKTTLNMEGFNAQEAIKELNKACEERHTGDDGTSIFWPDVDVLVTVNVEKK